MLGALRNRSVTTALGVTLGITGALVAHQRYYGSIRAEPLAALDPKQFVELPLKSAKDLSHDTKELVFDLGPDHVIGGETAFCVLFKFTKDGKPVIRPYTPVSRPDTIGEAVFVIKKYKDGAMSQHIHHLQKGDSVEVKGPIQKYKLGTNQHKQIGLIGGGAGITPLFQILQKIAEDPEDKTKVLLLYGSQTPKDILLKEEINSLIKKKPDQLKVQYFVDKAEDNFPEGNVGFITADVLSKNLFKPSDENVKVFVCGPPPLYKAISGNKKSPSDQGELTGALKDLGFDKEQVFKF